MILDEVDSPALGKQDRKIEADNDDSVIRKQADGEYDDNISGNMISFDASRISPSNNVYGALNTSANNAHNNTGFENLVGQLNQAFTGN